jgi:hypothetical protein
MIEHEPTVRQSRPRSTHPTAPTPSIGDAVLHMVLFAWFTLIEYIRSGRIWIEVGVLCAFYLVFLRGNIDANKFFSLASIFSVLLTIYTVSAVMGLGDRPQGYVVLARPIGRASYLLGLYSCALLIVMVMYLILSLLTATLSQMIGLSFIDWLLGTLPLLMNVALLGALVLLLSPLVLVAGWRLFILGLIAVAFSGNFFGQAQLDELPSVISGLLGGLQTALAWPLVPAFSGYTLSLSRDYGGQGVFILVAQISLTVLLLSLGLYSFSQRELVLSSE